jgi:hypothetical protein
VLDTIQQLSPKTDIFRCGIGPTKVFSVSSIKGTLLAYHALIRIDGVNVYVFNTYLYKQVSLPAATWTANVLKLTYDDHYGWRFSYKCVVALAFDSALVLSRVIN